MPEAPGPPFRITVYDRTLRRLGWVGAYESASFTVRHMATSTGQIVVRPDHPRVGALMQPGSRLVVQYDVPGDGATYTYLLSGRVSRRSGTVPSSTSLLTFDVEDDFARLGRLLAWPNPGGGVGQQGDAGAYYRVTGPAETVARQIIMANVERLGLPIEMAQSQGRGRTMTATMRMHPIAERLVPALDDAGIGLRVRQYSTGLVVECYEPTVRDRVLTDESGVLVGGEWSVAAPSATRVVVMGSGEGTAREFRTFVDSAREAEWGDVAEVARDARDVGSDLEQALADRAEKLGELRRTDWERDVAVANYLRAYRAYVLAHNAYLDRVPANEARLQQAREEALTEKDNAGADKDAKEAAFAEADAAYTQAQARVPVEQVAFEAEMAERGADALAEGAPTPGLSMQLAETASWRYGRTLLVGDSVLVRVTSGVDYRTGQPYTLDVPEVVREVTLSDGADEGLRATPQVGQSGEVSGMTMRAIARLAASLRDLRSGR